jgi:hypothetical protein
LIAAASPCNIGYVLDEFWSLLIVNSMGILIPTRVSDAHFDPDEVDFVIKPHEVHVLGE